MESEDLKCGGMEQFTGKKILITGATGFIGQHLSKRLLKFGAVVHGTSRYQHYNGFGLKDMYWWQGTFQDQSSARRILRECRPDYIFHLAGDVTAANDLKHVLSTYNSLLTSTINLLTEAVNLGCEKIVIAGSSTEPEDPDSTPASPYAAAKLATVTYGSLFQELYQLPVVLIRPFMGYGPLQPKSKLIPHVITSVFNGQAPKLSSGTWEVDWIYIDDLIDGILAATVHPEIVRTPVDLGTGKLTSVREVVNKIIQIFDTDIEPEFGALPDRFSEKSRIADVDGTYRLIHWKPKISLEKGLKKTIEWFRENEKILKPVYFFMGSLMYKVSVLFNSSAAEINMCV